MASSKYIFIITFFVVLSTISFYSIGQASSDIETFPEKETETMKVWTVHFNTLLSEESINRDTVYVKNRWGNRLPVTVYLGDNKKSVVIKPPLMGYAMGDSYSLQVTNGVESIFGIPLEKSIILKFTITEKSEELKEEDPKDYIARAKVTTSILNVRDTGSTNGKVVGKLTKGDIVFVYDVNGFWSKIRYNNQWAYVHKDFIKERYENKGIIEGQKIVVDAGHGDSDPGAIANGLKEKDVILKTSLLVQKKLESLKATVIMTRYTNTFLSLEQRVEIAKTNKADAFVSIHANAATNKSAKGAETFYDSVDNDNGLESKQLAITIQKQIVTKANMVDRGVKDNGFYVIRNNDIPAVLVELGFLTNVEDAVKLSSDQWLEIYADAIVQGIIDYYAQ